MSCARCWLNADSDVSSRGASSFQRPATFLVFGPRTSNRAATWCARSLTPLASSGLASASPRFKSSKTPPGTHTEHSEFHKGTAAWFAGIDAGGRAIFGVEESLLSTAIPVVGAMSHEVAHAFRRLSKIETKPIEVEEKRTDLTTIFLGFGVLTTNAAYVYRTSHQTDGLRTTRSTQYFAGGYLSDIELAYALGLQMELRQDRRKAAARTS